MSKIRKPWGIITVVVLVTSCLARSSMGGTVATDGTLGPARALSGPRFAIGPALGQQRGGNLFHSFSALNLDAGESATFTGPASVQNVFARVTSGRPSTIDGTLRCTIPSANFYLINPAGVLFFPGAALDVKGSFVVTTADTIKLGSGGSFNATDPAASTLTTAVPAAFGFLSPSPAGVSLRGIVSTPARLAVPRGRGLSVVSGAIQIVHGELLAPGGQATLVAVASPGQVTVEAPDSHAQPGLSSVAVFGDISLAANSRIILDGPAGGGFFIRAANLALDASQIGSTTLGHLSGSRGDVIASGTLRLTHASSITTNLSGAGRGGDLHVVVHHGVLDDTGSAQEAVIAANVSPSAQGQGGDLTITADTLQLVAGGQITANSSGRGQAGNLTLAASKLTLDGAGLEINTGVFTQAEGDSTRAAGRVAIHADSLLITGGAQISASTFGPGHGGDITLAAASVTLDGSGSTFTTGIFAQANEGSTGAAGDLAIRASTLTMLAAAQISDASGGTGDSGHLTVRADTIRLLSGAQISASTFGAGRGGNLNLTASTLILDGSGSEITTGIFAQSNGETTGDAGNLNVRAGTVRVLAGGQISAGTFGTGRGGNLSVVASSLVIDDRHVVNNSDATGIFASSTPLVEGGGAAGDLTIHAGSLQLLAGGQVAASTTGAGAGGSISVTAESLLIDGSHRGSGGSSIFADAISSGPSGSVRVSSHEGIIVSRGGNVSTSSSASTAGNLTLSSNGTILLDGATVSARARQQAGDVRISSPLLVQVVHRALVTTVSGAADGGDININALEVTLRESLIRADALQGLGGNISVAADATPGVVFTGPPAGRNMTATGKAGVSGNIQNGPANSDLAKSVAALPASLRNGELTLQPQCGQTAEMSTFLVQGRGATAEEPGFWIINLGLQP